MERIIHLSRFLAVITVIVATSLTGIVMGQTTHEVAVTNNVFTPKDIVINAGDTVKWINSQGFHNVNGQKSVYPNNPESFGNATGTGWTYSYVFTLEGKYDYRCDPHVGLGMVGTVTVVDDSGLLSLKVNFEGMNPHVGQMFKLFVKNITSGEYVDSLHLEAITESDFDFETDMIEAGSSYQIDFFADHNGNGVYDAPPVDHAWRLEALEVAEDTELTFTHNTNFTNIFPNPVLEVNFSSFNPHNGQDLWLALFDKASGHELYRLHATVEPEFTVEVGELSNGNSYRLDIFADHNGNGYYDAPPADHAWSVDIDDVNGDVSLDVAHNTNFTDINWQHRLTVSFEGMTPHAGQMFTLYVKEAESGIYMDTIMLESIPGAVFDIHSYGIMPGSSYHIDFYSDHNGNGQYDAPPADHAWRLELNDVMGDTTIMFAHNTNFTDIMAGSTGISINELEFQIKAYPNPFTDRIKIELGQNQVESEIRLINIAGQELKFTKIKAGQESIELEMNELLPGIYFLDINTEGKSKVLKVLKR